MSPAIDLNDIPERYVIEIKSTELPEERAAKLRREEADANDQRRRSATLFYVGLAVGVVVGAICLWASIDKSFSADTQKWASALVTSMMTGVVGYLTGKNSK